ncbi:glycosyltransferase family 9 protein [Aliamphritea ceti]|uniref:glycosyltransferase family 9 protein n=1 Tax=Aliamphritea ceti TaxID=1524258 RepID=UPI0021C403D9|nr:glycosyltransferase family 9 protein [Aliamphritea ceti]
MSRLSARFYTFARVLSRLPGHLLRKQENSPKRILIAHYLLLGDTLMLTPLLAKLRAQYPDADIFMTGQKAAAALYADKPYGVTYLPFHPKDAKSIRRLIAGGPYDLALVPADNRYSILAYAMGAKWIVAFSEDKPGYKSWLVDEAISYPDAPAHWADINTSMIPGDYPASFQASDWSFSVDSLPHIPKSFFVFHVGASSDLKLWPAERWRKLADKYKEAGFSIVWSGGPGEENIVAEIGCHEDEYDFSGKLTLIELCCLLQQASAMVCPDTGVAHLGRLANTPTVCLFGPGAPEVFGNCRFWSQGNYIALRRPISCRDQNMMFKRKITWLQRCNRNVDSCSRAAECMNIITIDDVSQAINQLLPAD